MLIGSQRKWIIYKEKLCKSAKNQTISGEESEIEKWTCLDDITKTRTKELQYIQSDSGMGDFFHAVDIVSKLYEGGDRNRFIDK